MAISIGNTTTVVPEAWTGSITLTAPAGIANDDILVMAVYYFGTTCTLPTGFETNRTNKAVGSDTIAIAWKRAAYESGDYVITHDNDALGCASLTVVRGCKTSDSPLNVAVSNTEYLTSDTTIRAAAISPTVEVALIWAAYNYGPAITVPSGYTEVSNILFDSNRLAVAYKLAVSAGSTGNVDGTAAGASDWKHAFMYALEPSGGGAPGVPTLNVYQQSSNIIVAWS